MNSNISVTIGCKYNPPKGGVAQVLYNYEKYVFPEFKCITNSGQGNTIYKLWKAISALIQLFFTLLFNKQIKIVHIHTASYNSFRRSAWFVHLGKAMHRKVILHIHGGGFKEFYQTAPQSISNVLNNCDCIITLSPKWQEYFKTITTCPMIEVVNNIIAPPTFLQTKRNDEKLHLLFLGLITEQKGIFDLLEVLSDHKNELEGKIVLHIGGNGKINKLKEIIQTHKIQDIIIYEGWVSGEKKIQLFNISDAFILPSYAEGLPVSILEAISYGLPILSTPVGGIPEVVNESNGILFEPGNKAKIYDSILKLIKSNINPATIKEQSYKYLPENIESQLDAIYKKLESL